MFLITVLILGQVHNYSGKHPFIKIQLNHLRLLTSCCITFWTVTLKQFIFFLHFLLFLTQVPCLECPRNSYSGEPPTGGFKDCQACPANTFTYQPSAATKELCKPKCPPGQYSPTGLAPCTVCPRDFYQATPGQTSCNECPSNMKTEGPGAIGRDECRQVNILKITKNSVCFLCYVAIPYHYQSNNNNNNYLYFQLNGIIAKLLISIFRLI